MAELVQNEAAKPNPALQSLAILVGTWTTLGTHPLVPGVTFHGRTSFAWMAGGAFLIMQSQIDEPQIPSAIAIFGTDDATGECFMLYFDERGVSRKYDVGVQGNAWKWWRTAPGFSQRMTQPSRPTDAPWRPAASYRETESPGSPISN